MYICGKLRISNQIKSKAFIGTIVNMANQVNDNDMGTYWFIFRMLFRRVYYRKITVFIHNTVPWVQSEKHNIVLFSSEAHLGVDS